MKRIIFGTRKTACSAMVVMIIIIAAGGLCFGSDKRSGKHPLSAYKKWEGLILAFEWAETSCPKTGNGVIDKLCVDLWYLERMEQSEDFIKVVKTFELPDGVSPRDWARPGLDPLKMLGLRGAKNPERDGKQ